MSTITLTQAHNKSPQEVRELAERLAVTLEERYQVHAEWRGDREVILKRSGVKGRLQLAEGEVHVELKLSLLMAPLKSRIESEIARSLAEKLA